MSDLDEKEATSAHKQRLGGLDPVLPQAGNGKVLGNEPSTLDVTLSSPSATRADVGDPERVAARIDVGDPDPTKEIQRFLILPYLIAERVVELARANQTFHLLSIFIARQALRRVLVLNSEVAKDGPNRAQLDERVRLQNQLVDLAAAVKEWGSSSGMEDVVSEGQQRRSLATSDRCQDQEQEIVSPNVGQVTQLQSATVQPTLDQVSYHQRIDQIKKQYYLFYPPTSSREDNFNSIVSLDSLSPQSRGPGRIINHGPASNPF